MTALIGNICLGLAALTSGILITTVIRYKAPHGGDGGVSAYPIWVLLNHTILFVLIAFAFIAVARKGGFDWFAGNKLLRYALLTIGLVAALYTSLISTMSFQRSIAEPALFRAFFQYAFVFVPVILIVTGFILMNSAFRGSVPVALYQWPLILVFGIGAFGTGTAILDDFLKARSGTSAQRYENAPSIIANHIHEIAQSDVNTDFVRILEFTGAIYPAEVREKAKEKIKSHPSWEKELVGLLENDRAMEAYNFLSWNEVEHKEMFPNAVYTGVISAANWIRANIQANSHQKIRHEMYTEEVNRVLQSVEKFEGLGTDYLPAIAELRSALNEPVPGQSVRYDCIAVLEDWIKKRM